MDDDILTGAKVAEILREAADEWLSPLNCYSGYSCDAVLNASPSAEYSPIMKFLRELGCNTFSFIAFKDVSDDERQGARFLWLDFAALVAEEADEWFDFELGERK